MMSEAKRRYVYQFAEKLEFLVAQKWRHGLSGAAFSVKCGMKKGWVKSVIAGGTQSVFTEVERKVAELCHFDLNWREWREGSVEDFKKRYLAEKASPTDAQPEASAPITPDKQQEGAGERPGVTIQNISNCSLTFGLTSEELAPLLAKTRLDAVAEQKFQTRSREVGETRHHLFPTVSMIQICALCNTEV